ncbi:hypothetical protein JOE34_002554 [Pseudomonas sp. PvP028]|nr:hypothetical protein [Pseudomonas sp. PvP028]
MREVDGGFSSYVVLERDTFEIKVEQRVAHVNCLVRVVALMPSLGKAG